MARVTVEDCIVRIPNRFDLVMLAAQRARDVASGSPLTVERDNDKNPVVALREIADETIDIENLAEALIQRMQKHVEVDEPEEDIVEFDAPQVGAPAGMAAEAESEDAEAEATDEEDDGEEGAEESAEDAVEEETEEE